MLSLMPPSFKVYRHIKVTSCRVASFLIGLKHVEEKIEETLKTLKTTWKNKKKRLTRDKNVDHLYRLSV